MRALVLEVYLLQPSLFYRLFRMWFHVPVYICKLARLYKTRLEKRFLLFLSFNLLMASNTFDLNVIVFRNYNNKCQLYLAVHTLQLATKATSEHILKPSPIKIILCRSFSHRHIFSLSRNSTISRHLQNECRHGLPSLCVYIE